MLSPKVTTTAVKLIKKFTSFCLVTFLSHFELNLQWTLVRDRRQISRSIETKYYL